MEGEARRRPTPHAPDGTGETPRAAGTGPANACHEVPKPAAPAPAILPNRRRQARHARERVGPRGTACPQGAVFERVVRHGWRKRQCPEGGERGREEERSSSERLPVPHAAPAGRAGRRRNRLPGACVEGPSRQPCSGSHECTCRWLEGACCPHKGLLGACRNESSMASLRRAPCPVLSGDRGGRWVPAQPGEAGRGGKCCRRNVHSLSCFMV